uniref:Uncharacterized protein n=1 Tax=Haemonchus contortus TaxID=6289 RepID=A0A7I4Z173_HAECO
MTAESVQVRTGKPQTFRDGNTISEGRETAEMKTSAAEVQWCRGGGDEFREVRQGKMKTHLKLFNTAMMEARNAGSVQPEQTKNTNAAEVEHGSGEKMNLEGLDMTDMKKTNARHKTCPL